MDKVIKMRVRLPFDIDLPLAPEGPFFDLDGNVQEEMLEWLSALASYMRVLESAPCEETMYWFITRTRNTDEGRPALEASRLYEFSEAGEWLGEGAVGVPPEDFGSADNPLVCAMKAAYKGYPDGPRFYLSDFQYDGKGARHKVLEAVDILSNLPFPIAIPGPGE